MHLSRPRLRGPLALATALTVAFSTAYLVTPAGATATASPMPVARVVAAEQPEVVVDPGYDGPRTGARGLRADGVAAAAYPLDRTFALHSAPGARRTLYLDFDGTAALGARWGVGGSQPGWSLDAGADFNQTELGAIQDVWQMVAEDYAPFEVDVTTEDPGAAAITRTDAADGGYGTRVLMTGSRTMRSSLDTVACGEDCGGVAYAGIFDVTQDHAGYQPALVFPQNLNDDATSMAAAASHEAGHTLGLQHQGTVAHDGVAASEYQAGQGLWGPIMGSPYDAPLSQWSRGDYAWASRQQDDLAVMSTGGAPLRTDVVGATVGTAVPLPAPRGTPAATGVVESRGDVDVFALGTCSGAVRVGAEPAAGVGPDLDLSLTLLDRDGRVLGAADPPATRETRTRAAGLGATVAVDAASGTALYAAVDGVGGAGYSDYGSMGRYLLDATGCVPTGNTPGPPRSLTAATASSGTVSLSWAAPGTGPVAGYTVSVSPGGLIREEPGGSTGTVVTGLRAGTSYRFSVLARDAAGTTSSPAVATVVLPARAPGALASLDVTAGADGRAEVTWTAPLDDGGSTIGGYLLQVGALSQVFVPTVRSVSVSGLTPGASYTVVVSAINAVGTGPGRGRAITVPGGLTSSPAATGVAGRGGSDAGRAAGSPALSPVVAPARRGAPRVGSRLGIRTGTWPVPVTTRYRWLIDGRAVSGAHRSSLRLSGAWAGRRVSARLTVAAPGYRQVRRTISWGRVRR